ncbi:cell division protein FtsB [Microbacterium endophyticum]|uniref:Cell division protein FtsB n=1 Tax=Microbacterium endophyticum TaxID=1526412 RepID=A0A7W4V0Z9_9MICO|nr:septum formation initiator family protein [Microbacterium endophyticum]MBB2974863.1 cell division protein FtsB [Microbacterium endophyticum]NIK37160.1 cell division protein FtsB [Microbacterium endophyticum]
MSKPTAPPSALSGKTPRRPGGSARQVDAREWLGGIRLSGFMVIMLGLVVLGVFVLVPTFGTYLDQRQQIDALENSIQLTKDDVADLEAQRDRWSDPAYITTQARERLYYFNPGEVGYLIDNDLPESAIPQEEAPISTDVEQAKTDWMTQMVRSVTAAGLAQTATEVDDDGTLSQ